MWNQQIMDALRAWLATDTWYKSHALDDERFYNFVSTYWREHGRIWDESQAAQIITNEAKSLHPGFDPSEMARVIDRRRSEGTLILDYLAQTNANP